ncbi:MAG: helix-turn-helix domain-containing protein [Cyclobacteriaceae bacterium]
MTTIISTHMSPEELERLMFSTANRAAKMAVESIQSTQNKQNEEPATPLLMKGVCDLTGLARPTIYRLVQANDIPHFRRSKTLYFDREEVLKWLKGRSKK